MKTNTAILVVVATVAIGGALFISSDGVKNQAEPVVRSQVESAITIEEGPYDFGEIDIYGGVVETNFSLTNTGVEDVAITDGTTSCGCTNAELEGIRFGMHEVMSREFVIPAGETKLLKVIYDPLAHGPSGVGLAQRSVYLKTNSLTTPTLEVRIKALVTNNN
jgi:hypothetical protein